MRLSKHRDGDLAAVLAAQLLRHGVVKGVVCTENDAPKLVSHPEAVSHSWRQPSTAVVGRWADLVMGAVARPLAVLAGPHVVHALHKAQPAMPLYLIGRMASLSISDDLAKACPACADPTNRLADISVGAPDYKDRQWIIMRNARGAIMWEALGDTVFQRRPFDLGDRTPFVKSCLARMQSASPGRWYEWAAPLREEMRRRFGPRGLEWARAQIEVQAYALSHACQGDNAALPAHLWPILNQMVSPKHAEAL
ncbi:MAG: Coenzyme F420 hydrogenase/dehydrogenase, beta subunit C-terminal domain [Marinovum sp.]|nr:Coenzyme F420 hydrogenase/dehydrogenase, beta subunit C-terminal domain [Marinovum sp.]